MGCNAHYVLGPTQHALLIIKILTTNTGDINNHSPAWMQTGAWSWNSCTQLRAAILVIHCMHALALLYPQSVQRVVVTSLNQLTNYHSNHSVPSDYSSIPCCALEWSQIPKLSGCFNSTINSTPFKSTTLFCAQVTRLLFITKHRWWCSASWTTWQGTS